MGQVGIEQRSENRRFGVGRFREKKRDTQTDRHTLLQSKREIKRERERERERGGGEREI